MKTENFQQPLNSPFDKDSTATDVLKDISLAGKVIIITGGHSGLGLESTRAFAAADARVIVGARNIIAAREAVKDIPGVEVYALDLSDLSSVAHFAAGVMKMHPHIDILMNNAGIMACPLERLGSNNLESQFAINHLGHFVLVNRLWPVLKGGSRVVVTSSAGHHLSDIRWNDINFNEGYDKWLAYGQSKTANILFSAHLDYLGKADGIRSFSLHPGKIFTPLQRHLTIEEMIDAQWLDKDGLPADPTFKTPAQGAATQVWASTTPLLNGMGGLYCEDCNIADITHQASFVGVRDYAIDPAKAARLWELSLKLTGITHFDKN
ncbi:protochlorophyllide reductase [Chitinophaga jiangningensis]|uniref:Probable oxidoreductase n=1 Tax=Chitinophaga jiangningensis TaxID=1419482 RepID=A0A1M6YED0_9BACT|nr:SDR family NAD(P)-dependent oxidoreductase [Chitinophaga jiangningensis]SHL16385.1 protochlorophyllide reductase [Chitinophaga jiangningensis]